MRFNKLNGKCGEFWDVDGNLPFMHISDGAGNRGEYAIGLGYTQRFNIAALNIKEDEPVEGKIFHVDNLLDIVG